MVMYSIEECIEFIQSPELKEKVKALWKDYESRFRGFPAAGVFHSCYTGGLYDHTRNVINLAINHLKLMQFYYTNEKSEPKDLCCNQDDIILVALIHDMDKCYKYEPETEYYRIQKGSSWRFKKDVLAIENSGFIAVECARYGILLTPIQLNALTLHHGGFSLISSSVYSKGDNANANASFLAIMLHTADYQSSHILEREPDMSLFQSVPYEKI